MGRADVPEAGLPALAEPVVIAVALLYFGAVLAIGAWATARTRGTSDFYIAGRTVGLLAISLSAMSASLSGFAFIGGPGLVYQVGLGALFIILPVGITNALAAWALGGHLRRMAEERGVLTLPGAVGVRYESPGARALAAVAVLVAVVGYIATNVLALGIVVDAVFQVGVGTGIWLGTALTVAYAAGGGILAGVYTDVFQGALMALASVLVFYFVLQVGPGLEGLSRTILAEDPGFLEPWGRLTPLAALSFFFVFSVGVLGQPQIIHKFFMLKDPERLRWFPLLATGALAVMLLLFFGVGIAVRALVLDGRLPEPTHPDQATPLFLLHRTPLFLAALLFAGLAAAIMSTVNAFMNIGAAALTHDLPRALGRPLDRELAWGRAGTVALSAAAAAAAHASDTLVAFLGIFGWGLFAATLVPALAVGLNWPGATRGGAIASIATALVLTVAGETALYLELLTLPGGITLSALTLVASLLVFVGVSLVTRRPATRADVPGRTSIRKGAS